LSRTLAWVLGGGGFLGSRLARALPVEVADLTPFASDPPRLHWTDPAVLDAELEANVKRFADEAVRAELPWMIVWCAGRGVVSTPAAALEAETRTLESLLEKVGRHLADPAPRLPGAFVLSSSAGGVWGDAPGETLTEATPCRPLSDYGRFKLRQEESLRAWAASRPQVRHLIARISNLYGPGQDLDKPQGLISHLTRALIFQKPVHIYVPLDTLRDYFYVEDCARHIARCAARLQTEPPGAGRVKIFAAGRSHSIASVLGVLGRIAKRHPKVITAAHASGRQQPRSLLFRSTVWLDVPPPTHMDLAVGIHAVYQDHAALFRQGRLRNRA
jgi:UDP-glucose 4-epimerase